MPNRDGTGPQGKGKLTGRRNGNCKKDDNEPCQKRLNCNRRRNFQNENN